MYKKQADALSDKLTEAFPGCKIMVNPQKPKSKSFEISLLKENDNGKFKESCTYFSNCN